MTEPTSAMKPSLLVFADDWGRHPSSCQHLIGRMPTEHRVCWVNTIGTRPPRLNLATVRRGLEKCRHWFASNTNGNAALPANLRVASPKMWPWFNSRAARWLNRRLLVSALSPMVRAMPSPVVAVTTLPIMADLVGHLPVDRWVYYCVDDFSTWPGLDRETMRRMEEELIGKVDRLIAVSDKLHDQLSSSGREVALLTHGVDVEFWRLNGSAEPLPALRRFERPLVVFWGVIDRRMDVEFVRQLGGDMTSGTILLVGRLDHPDPALFDCPRVVHVPPMAHDDLPQLAAAADVLVMPYADLSVTRAMQPLKMTEYLATDKPAVVRDLPSTQAWSDCLDLAATPEEFSALVRRRLYEGLPERQVRCRCRLADESWVGKVEQFRKLICDTAVRSPAPPPSHVVVTR